jgi:hypothetical protein
MKRARLQITYAPPSVPEARGQRCFVVVRLEPLGDKVTRITLHHTGWGDGGQRGTGQCRRQPRLLQSAT